MYSSFWVMQDFISSTVPTQEPAVPATVVFHAVSLKLITMKPESSNVAFDTV